MGDVSRPEVASDLADLDADGHGHLLDVFVDDCTLADWQRVLDGLREQSTWPVAYLVDGVLGPLPSDAEDAWRRTDEATVMLEVWLPFRVVGHFFGIDGMEFDARIRDLDTDHHWDALLGFAAWLHGVVDRPVLLASAWDHDHALVRVENGRAGLVTR